MVSSAGRRGTRVVADGATTPAMPEGASLALSVASVHELPWLTGPLQAALARQQGHALLVHADPGVGALEFAFALAQAWLCESDETDGPPVERPCGHCMSCRLARAQTHGDLMLRLPQVLALQHGLAVEVDDRRKPSRQVRIGELRQALDWAVTTSGRGRGKVLLIHPAEAMNLVTASALLKTLEEPPAGLRIILTTADPGLLMPTVLSRCQRVVLQGPAPEQALGWLRDRGVPDAQVLLDGAGGRPLTVLRWHAEGLDARAWSGLPRAVARGDASGVLDWPVARLVDALLKLAHDAALLSHGSQPRFFPRDSMPGGIDLAMLWRWQQSLLRVARHAEHPWSEGLLAEALFAEAAEVWQGGGPGRGRAAVDTLTSRAV